MKKKKLKTGKYKISLLKEEMFSELTQKQFDEYRSDEYFDLFYREWLIMEGQTDFVINRRQELWNEDLGLGDVELKLKKEIRKYYNKAIDWIRRFKEEIIIFRIILIKNYPQFLIDLVSNIKPLGVSWTIGREYAIWFAEIYGNISSKDPEDLYIILKAKINRTNIDIPKTILKSVSEEGQLDVDDLGDRFYDLEELVLENGIEIYLIEIEKLSDLGDKGEIIPINLELKT